jgi:EmrB/QacA subfamily drug resistance transporter
MNSGQRRAIGAALLSVFLGALDLTVIATILPAMVTDLRINAADVDRYVWIVNSYLIAYVVAIPLVGRASDLLGRTHAFLGALAIFVVGSVGCALADGLASMVLARAIQGAGGGALLPITMALVGDLFPTGRRAAVLGIVGAVDTLGWVLGPLWGALLMEIGPGAQTWRWAFIVNVPLAIGAGVAIARSSGDGHFTVPNWIRRLDLPGALLLGVSLLALNLGLSSGGELGAATAPGRALGGTRNPLAEYAAVLVVLAVSTGALFVIQQIRAPWPLLPVRLFAQPRFSAAIAANFLVGASLIVTMVDVPVITSILVPREEASRTAALMLAPFTMLIAIISVAGGRITTRLGTRFTAYFGLLLVAIGYAALWFGLRNAVLLGMTPGLVIAGAGFGLVFAPISATAIDSAPDADRGVASAMTLVFRLLGMTVGISILTAIAIRRLQGLVGDLEAVVQTPGESTADFLARQTALLYETVLPITLLVVRESFLIAGVAALLALAPVARFPGRAALHGDA